MLHRPFNISALDADQLRRGLVELGGRDPARAAAIHQRARESRAAFAPGFLGDPATGALSGDDAAEEAFFEAHPARPCPALDPATGLCELYPHRPIGYRTYGPPMRIEGVDLPPCRLCFVESPSAEIAARRSRAPPSRIRSKRPLAKPASRRKP